MIFDLKNDLKEEVSLRGEKFLIRQALTNLFQNAVEFSVSGGKISVKINTEAESLEIIIEDEGPGIPEYAESKIFDRFFSLQRPDTGKKSTGLGLNFVREVSKLHGGNVTIENKHDRGVRATLTLSRVPH